MNTPHGIALYIDEDLEAAFISFLEEASSEFVVVRRCADSAELRAVGEAGIAQAAVLSGLNPDVDATFCEELHRSGLKVIIISSQQLSDQIGAGEYHSIGADIVAPDHDPAAILNALEQLFHSSPQTHSDTTIDEQFSDIISHDAHSTSAREDLRNPTGARRERLALDDLPRRITASSLEAHNTRDPHGNKHVTTSNDEDHAPDSNGEEYDTSTPELGEVCENELVSDKGAESDGLREETPAPKGIIIAVYGTSGAPGRTTTTINVAAELAHDASVVILDADLNAPSIAHSLGLAVDGSSLSALARLRARGTLTPVHLTEVAYDGPHGLKILTGLSSTHRWREAAPSTVEAIIDVCRQTWDYTIIDLHAPNLDPVDDFHRSAVHRDHVLARVLTNADGILVVTRADAVGLHRFSESWEWLENLVPNTRKIIAANMAQRERTGSEPRQAIALALATTIPGESLSVIPADTQVLTAMLKAKTLGGTYKRSARGAFRDIANRIQTELVERAAFTPKTSNMRS